MSGELIRECWRAFSCSIIGASHTVCQDASKHEEGADFVFAAVADGHGSVSCPFSADGAELAVEAACDVMKKLARELTLEQEPGLLKRMAIDRLSRDIVHGWRCRVAEKHKEKEREPLLNGEMDEAVFLKYGTTLLCAMVTKNFLLLSQLGDGDILLVNELGEVLSPIRKDERMLGNDTLSLCSKNAAANFRDYFLPHGELEKLPSLILLSTDGYANSFKSESGFQQAAVDFFRLIQDGGQTVLKNKMPEWLAETTRDGSGDDVSLALLYQEPKNSDGSATTDVTDAKTG